MLDAKTEDNDRFDPEESGTFQLLAVSANDNAVSQSERLQAVFLVIEAAIGHPVSSGYLNVMDGPLAIERKTAMSELEIAKQQLDIIDNILKNRKRLFNAGLQVTENFKGQFERQYLLVQSLMAELALLNYLAQNGSSFTTDRIKSLNGLVKQLRAARKPIKPIRSLKPPQTIIDVAPRVEYSEPDAAE